MGALVVLVATLVACRPIPLGGATAQIGNDVESCASFQPDPSCPTPQSMVWAAIQAPHTRFEDGDPYSTKCGTGTVTPSACTPGAPTFNANYDPTGYEYAIDVTAADIGKPLTFQVWDAAHIQRTIASSGSTAGIDCHRAVAPFSGYPAATWSSFGSLNCQTGDQVNTRAPLQVQVFDNDGVDDSIAYDTPLGACHLYLSTGTTATGTGSTIHKNAWTSVCTFTPDQVGVYPVRVKTSNIVLPDGTVVADVGSGFNGFALRVTGGSTTRLHGTVALSMWKNGVGASSRIYLAEITSEDAGRRLQIDAFDPGDGSGSPSDYTVQVLAPPSGAAAGVPSTGTPIPAPGLADSCRYNPVGSPTRGPDVAAPAGSAAPNCVVTTRLAGTSVYNGKWLSIEIDIAPDYACSTDCWWTLVYDFGSASVPTDRTVWSPIIIDKPASA